MKLLFSDFDRTLYVNRDITQENLDAVNKWQSEGNLFIITTGRHKRSIIEQMKNFNLKPDYYICNNGAVILDKEKNTIFSKCISNQKIEEIVKYICENYENSFEIIEKERVIKIMNDAGIDNHNPTELVSDLNTRFRSSLAAYANVLNVDIVANGVNKSTGIDFVCKELNDIDDILVIGDSYNDIEMVQKYNGFTVEHGNEDIKKIAREIFPDVASLLKKYS